MCLQKREFRMRKKLTGLFAARELRGAPMRSISELSSAPPRTTIADSHIQVSQADGGAERAAGRRVVAEVRQDTRIIKPSRSTTVRWREPRRGPASAASAARGLVQSL